MRVAEDLVPYSAVGWDTPKCSFMEMCVVSSIFAHRKWVSILFIPYWLPTSDLQLAEIPCHDTLNSVNTYLIGV